MVWQSIPSQLAKENKKFIYGVLKSGSRASQFEMAIQWLQDAGLVYLTRRVSAVKMPLKFYEDFSAFKLYMLDVGLLGAMMDVTAAAILVKNNIFSEYKKGLSRNCMSVLNCKEPTSLYITTQPKGLVLRLTLRCN